MGYRARSTAQGQVVTVLPFLHLIVERTRVPARNHGPAGYGSVQRRLAGVAFDAHTAAVLATALDYAPPEEPAGPPPGHARPAPNGT